MLCNQIMDGEVQPTFPGTTSLQYVADVFGCYWKLLTCSMFIQDLVKKCFEGAGVPEKTIGKPVRTKKENLLHSFKSCCCRDEK